MIRHMDEGIGRILEALDRTGAAENTLVVFTSDNGGERFSDTWPLVGEEDGPAGGRHPRALHRALARRACRPGGTTAQLAITMDWVATFLEAAGVGAASRLPARRHQPAAGAGEPGAIVRARAVLAHELPQPAGHARRATGSTSRSTATSSSSTSSKDQRERANRGRHERERLAAMRDRYAAWEATIPPLPPDATFSIPYTKADLAQPS